MSNVQSVSSRKGEVWTGVRKDSSYGPGDRMPLLTPIGRVLIAVLENPNCKLADLAPMLGLGESRVSFALSSLVEDKILVRTRQAGRNSYKINENSLTTHPDISHLVRTFLPILVDGLETD